MIEKLRQFNKNHPYPLEALPRYRYSKAMIDLKTRLAQAVSYRTRRRERRTRRREARQARAFNRRKVSIHLHLPSPRQIWPQTLCTAPECPILMAHAEGPYRHNGLTPKFEDPSFGFMVPPPYVRQALRWWKDGREDENDVKMVKGFLRCHGSPKASTEKSINRLSSRRSRRSSTV